tara:strand:+ start:176 stop:757 length:582 start_codon:yes stop_codon:yes gene_type:complete
MPFHHLLRLLGLHDRLRFQHALPAGAGVNDAVAAENRTGTENAVATDFCVVTDDGAKLPESCIDITIFGISDDDVGAIQTNIGANDTGSQVAFVSDNAVSDVVKMRYFGSVEKQAVFELAGIAEDAVISANDILPNVGSTADSGACTDPSWPFNDSVRFNDDTGSEVDALTNDSLLMDGSIDEGAVDRFDELI